MTIDGNSDKKVDIESLYRGYHICKQNYVHRHIDTVYQDTSLYIKCIWNHVCVYMSLINKFASRSIILWRKILFSDINSTEEDTEESKSENKFKFKSDIAVFHASITSKIKERRNLLRNIGPFRRALCARRDLEIRRQLCKIDKVKQEL